MEMKQMEEVMEVEVTKLISLIPSVEMEVMLVTVEEMEVMEMEVTSNPTMLQVEQRVQITQPVVLLHAKLH